MFFCCYSSCFCCYAQTLNELLLLCACSSYLLLLLLLLGELKISKKSTTYECIYVLCPLSFCPLFLNLSVENACSYTCDKCEYDFFSQKGEDNEKVHECT